ncbi:metallophosphoesterase [Actinoplanes campanulatus]|uniref:metallophosphoesterase n=1 Tax=Actinoplanes campanulatus TaxID=113559 RepID=UPI001EF3201B|nr:metallophosphoesterase [Actinoplanes capillaceus]
MLFIAMVLVIVGLIHFYLWKRLVRDPLRPGPARRAGTILAVLLFVLFPVTMGGVRAGHLTWLAWPGYLWIAVMFYLLITLLVLEIPRLVALRLWARNPGEASDRASRSPGAAPAPGGPAAEPLPTGEPALNGAASEHGSESIGGGEPTLSGTGAVTLNEHGGEPALSGATSGHASAPAASDRGGEPSLSGRASGHGSASHGGGELTLGAGGAATVDTVDESGAGGVDEAGLDGESGGASREPADGGAAGHGGAGQGPGMDRRLLLARGTAIFAGLTAASITGYGVKTATGAPQIDRVRLPIAKLPRSMDGTRLAVVSDIHIGPLTGVEHARRITRVINSVNADLVCVVGDLVDGSVAELGRFAAPLGGIESRHGAFFVTGNHEYYSGAEEWVEEVARLGIRPLRNERVEINGLDLAGVNDLTGEEQGDGPDFARALGDRDTTRPVVLMAHQPVAAKEAAPYGVDLQVSGHTHGGQMAPFNMLVRLQQPVVSGFGEVDGVPVYVTNGAGFWGPPVRVGAPPQVTVIELRVA